MGLWVYGSVGRWVYDGFMLNLQTYRPTDLRTYGPTIAAVWLSISSVVYADESSRPNILVILADDLAVDAVGALGGREVETPNIDRLARAGATFTHTYNQGGWNGAVCIASRAMLMTGRFLWHAQADESSFRSNYVAQQRFWPQRLASVGYRTYFTGKWHVNAAAENVFHETRHVRPGMPHDGEHNYNRPRDDRPDSWDPTDPAFGGFWQGGRHWSEVVADDVEHFLTDALERSEPFFIYTAFNAPHDPRQSPAEYLARYPLDRVSVPPNFLPLYPLRAAMDAGHTLRDELLAPFPRSEHAVRVHRREYYAIVTHMDAQIGRILKRLDDEKLWNNTYVIFTADHGLACGQHGLLGKQNMFDHSMRVPFIIVGPQIRAGRRVEAPIYLQDMVPTTIELSGQKIPTEIEFRSLLPLLTSGGPPPYEAIYGAYLRDAQRMICDGPWKLVLYPRAGETLLFHRGDDPHEMRNLAAEPQHASRLREMFARLQQMQVEMGDSLRLGRSYPHLLADQSR